MAKQQRFDTKVIQAPEPTPVEAFARQVGKEWAFASEVKFVAADVDKDTQAVRFTFKQGDRPKFNITLYPPYDIGLTDAPLRWFEYLSGQFEEYESR